MSCARDFLVNLFSFAALLLYKFFDQLEGVNVDLLTLSEEGYFVGVFYCA